MAETLVTLGRKVDELSASVDKRFEQVDRRFEQVEKLMEDGFTAVAEQFAEQRAYTEFAYARLETAMTGRLNGLETAMTGRLNGLETAMTGRYDQLENAMTGRFDRLERKLDQILAGPPRPRRRKRP